MAIILSLINLNYPNYDVSRFFGNNTFGYYCVFSQFPCFCIGIYLYINYHNENDFGIFRNLIKGILMMIVSVIVFFVPFFSLSYIICASLTGISAYYIIKAMISYEDAHEGWLRKGTWNFLRKMGNMSLYVFLVHGFFAWTFVSIAKNILTRIGINADSYIVYIVLLPVVVFLSYIAGYIYKRIVTIIVQCFNKIVLLRCKPSNVDTY
jgi:hypothetical protein